MKNYTTNLLCLFVLTSLFSGSMQSMAVPWMSERFAREKAREEYERKKYEAEVLGDIDQKLISAAHMHDERLVQRLLGAGANVNARKKSDGTTPLINVVSLSSVNPTGIVIAQILLKAGADLNGQDDEGATPFIHAACWSNTEMGQFLIDAGFTAIDSPLHDGRTALMIAATYGCKDMVKMLLGKRANIHVKDRQGFTALTSVALQLKGCTEQRRPDYEEVIQDLMEAGAEVNKEIVQQYPEMKKFVAQKLNYYLDLMKECVQDKECC